MELHFSHMIRLAMVAAGLSCFVPASGGFQLEARKPVRTLEQRRNDRIDELRSSHPEWPDSRIEEQIESEFNGKPPSDGPSGLPPGLLEPRESIELRPPPSLSSIETADFRNSAASRFMPAEARGWAYVGYASSTAGNEQVTYAPNGGRPRSAEKFVLVDHSRKAFAHEADLDHVHTIELPYGTRLPDGDLSRFFSANNRFRKDVPEPGVLRQPDRSNSLAVTGARLANGKEILAVFPLVDLARTGAVHGRLITGLAAEQDYSQLQLKPVVIGAPEKPDSAAPEDLTEGLTNALQAGGGRVFYYGDDLKTVDVERICSSQGYEMVLRSPDVPSDIVETEHRLQQIADRPISLEQLTVVDGIPQDKRAVEAMGPFSGDPGVWLDFRKRVNESLAEHDIQRITTPEDFFRELKKGTGDLLILIAHSTGSQLYLNGRKTSVRELQSLPARQRSARPRLAVLVSCDTGKPQGEARRLFGRDLPSLAQILIEKKFVDKVIAPDHKIGADESLTVLQRVLKGAHTGEFFDGWRTWSVLWRRQSMWRT